LGLECGAKYYGLCSSLGAKVNSWLLYTKTKGRVENGIKELGYPITTIFRPGHLLNRENDYRFGEKVLHFMPGFILPYIETKEVGKAMLNHALWSLDHSR
jgi:uncharacterized protein YbjT (DUF2867 family)